MDAIEVDKKLKFKLTTHFQLEFMSSYLRNSIWINHTQWRIDNNQGKLKKASQKLKFDQRVEFALMDAKGMETLNDFKFLLY